MEFRKDINGLRAIAVLSVLCYHFGLPGFTGGFIGVDVFFVISGFLMTGIIVTALEKGTFSIWSFYAARVRRIVPALMALCITLLVLGWFWLSPADYATFGKHAANALIFNSNFKFKREAGYFDSFSQDKWLLHTWSLSLEWQFYLLLPILLLVLWRWRSRRLIYIALGLLAALSLAVSIVATPTHAAFSFFLLPARAWELLAGSLAFIAARRWPQWSASSASLIHLAALFLIALSVSLFDASVEWPGYAALLPVAAAALLVAVRHPARPPLLAGGVIQSIGSWSYSIYLWHWPVFVALRHAEVDAVPLWIGLGIVASVVLGFLSYRFIETPFRSRSAHKPNRRRAAALLAFSFTALCGLAVHRYEGFPQRVSSQVLDIESTLSENDEFWPKPCTETSLEASYPECRDDTPSYALLGDSHAGAAFQGVHQAAHGRYGIVFTKSCPPFIGGYLLSKRRDSECPDFTAAAMAAIDTLPPAVPLIVITRLSYYIHGYNEHPDKKVELRYLDVPDSEVRAAPEDVFIRKTVETMCWMTTSGRPVYVLQPLPEIGVEVARVLSRQLMFGKPLRDISIPLGDYYKRHRTALTALRQAEKDCGIRLLDPVPYLCSNGVCHGSQNGIPYYYDDDHLSVAGAHKLAPLFEPIFQSP